MKTKQELFKEGRENGEYCTLKIDSAPKTEKWAGEMCGCELFSNIHVIMSVCAKTSIARNRKEIIIEPLAMLFDYKATYAN